MAFDLVFFGGTGDLTWRKLMPALFQAFRHGKLPEGGRILAVARQELSDDDYRAWLKERFQEVEGAKRPSDEEFARFAALLHYLRMDLSQPERLRAASRQWLRRARSADVVVMYLATAPDLFPTICAQLGAAGLNGAERPRRAREAARPRPGERAARSTASCARCSARSRPSASTTTSASRRCRT